MGAEHSCGRFGHSRPGLELASHKQNDHGEIDHETHARSDPFL